MTLPTLTWPFPVSKPEKDWDDSDRELLSFLTSAFAEGFNPRLVNGYEPEAGSPELRQVTLVFRGSRNGWEPFLAESHMGHRLGPRLGHEECRTIVVRPFRAAAHLALEWLRGRALDAILKDFALLGGWPIAITLKDEIEFASKAIR